VLAKSAVCNRTSQVADAIAAAVPGASDCNNVTDIDLALITSLDLSDKSITSLSADDFAGLISLTSLDLSDNQLESLPDGFFANLSSLTTVDLSGNSVDPIPLTLSLEKVGDDQFKVVAPLGAPFDIVLPISVANGSFSDNASSVTILQSKTESVAVSVVRTPDTSDAVTVDFGTLPNLPTSHSGYSLAKSNQDPLEIIPALNVAPVFTDGESTTRSVAERTEANSNIGDAVSATDDDGNTLTYTLSGTDAASFAIDSTNGQLKTVVDLDYETKTSYSVTITVSDDILTDVIDVTINVIDIDDNRRPVFTEGDSATRIVAENTGSGVDIGSPVSATDPDEDTLTYSLGGTDASTFSIDSTSGQLSTNGALDYETKSTYSVNVTVSDSEFSDSIDITINITDLDETGETDTDTPNTAPVFTEGDSATRSIAENTGSGVDIGDAVSA
ncbi:cadherin domain-containing protein, partial [Candidatus Poribacteria bacterium]|nr:cadherin domain-containing protein [Candidatus Poribacteria bacterium]